MPRLTLLTDFGTVDGYVGAMKGVIASVAPDAQIDDIAHDIPPGDLRAAAWTISRYWMLYPPDTVHVVVVDPGVGGPRRALASEVRAEDGPRFFVAPDNGVLTRVFAARAPRTVVSIENDSYVRDEQSSTFHGRDVFAPAAAHLAAGSMAIDELGPAIPDFVCLELPEPRRNGNEIDGRAVHVDRFGTLVTNVPEDWVGENSRVQAAGRNVGPIRTTYADVEPGELLALIGSAGVLEISVRDGSAAELLGADRGTPVAVTSGD